MNWHQVRTCCRWHHCFDLLIKCHTTVTQLFHNRHTSVTLASHYRYSNIQNWIYYFYKNVISFPSLLQLWVTHTEKKARLRQFLLYLLGLVDFSLAWLIFHPILTSLPAPCRVRPWKHYYNEILIKKKTCLYLWIVQFKSCQFICIQF